jgi:toxin YoeB
LEFEPEAFEDLVWWIEHDMKKIRRILSLIREIQRTPFQGTGKPEPLRGDLSGAWSRRIDKKHRIVYKVFEDKILITAIRGHYE